MNARVLRDPKLVLALLSAAAVAWLVWHDLERVSPGPISRTHEQVAELANGAGCEACHGDGFDGMPEACRACHEEVDADFTSGTGLHGQLAADLADDCGRCHVEHHGLAFPLVTERSFEQAGARGPDDFDHELFAFHLEGKHAELGCVDCHEHAEDKLLAEGSVRFVGLDQDCASCHEDPHEGRMVRECAECHGQELPFEQVASFVHADFELEGAHAGLSCSECHPQEGPTSVIELGATAVIQPRGCEACHENEHTPAFLAGAGDCATCHAAVDESFAGHGERMPLEAHAASGFALEEPHAELECAACHAPAPATFAERFPGRSASACEACHDDPHGREFEGRACLECHASDHFAPSVFAVDEHARTDFPLEGEHAQVSCAECHPRSDPELPPRFDEAPTTCNGCHDDAHLGKLAASEPIPDPLDCSRCHLPTRFAQVEGGALASLTLPPSATRLAFAHDRDTGFPLAGAHAEADCAACHPEHPEPDERGRRFGFAQRLANAQPLPARPTPVERDFSDCASCHVDPHWGVFEAVDGGCASCHDERSFAAAAEEFDHARAGFALEGAHASAACEACHPTLDKPDANGRRFARAAERFPGSPDDCGTCHADPHDGAFRGLSAPSGLGEGGCERCHTTTSFQELARPFEHEAWAGYPLSEDHDDLACVACHVPAGSALLVRGAPDAQRFSRHGRVAGRACSDCHADPHAGQFQTSERGGLCARCHLDAGGLGFDHQTDSRFALDEDHAKLSCDACHLPWPLADGTEVIRYRPLGTTCADCHGPVGDEGVQGGRR